MRRQGKKAKAAYVAAVHEVFAELGVSPLNTDHRWAFMYTHCLNTKHGELVLSVDPSTFRGVSVFGRFTDVKRANAERPSTGMYGDHNCYTGKWNLHCMEDDTTPEIAADELRLRLSKLTS